MSKQASLKATLSLSGKTRTMQVLPWELWHALLHYDLDIGTNHRVPSCGGMSSYTKAICGVSASEDTPFTDGWRNSRCRLLGWPFWCAEFAQRHTEETRWRRRLCCLHPPSLILVAAQIELHLSSESVENCGQTAAWVPSGSGWHSSPEFWAGWENKTKMT